MGVELPLRVVVTILECCVTFSGVKLSIRSFVLFIVSVLLVSAHIQTCYYALNKILSSDCLNTDLTLYSYLVGCCPISDFRFIWQGRADIGQRVRYWTNS